MHHFNPENLGTVQGIIFSRSSDPAVTDGVVFTLFEPGLRGGEVGLLIKATPAFVVPTKSDLGT